MTTTGRTVAGVLAAAVVLTGCAGGASTAAATPTPTSTGRPFAPAIRVGPLELGDGQVLVGADGATATFTVRNDGGQTDTLTGVTTPVAASVTLGGGLPAAVPPHADLVLSRPGRALSLRGLSTPLTPGDSVPVVLRFARQGPVAFVLPVIGTGGP